MKTRIGFLIALFASIIMSGFLSSIVVSAQQPTPSDDEVNAIARQLYCPVCENTPLDVCPTTACHQWRELIRQMLVEGKTAEEIKQYFVDYYGARVLSEPPRSGIFWLVYVIPPLAFLVGVYLLFMAFRTWRKFPKEPLEDTNKGSDFEVKVESDKGSNSEESYISQLESELKRRE
jgi:cytochrome c-type biogenesis protein CcmH